MKHEREMEALHLHPIIKCLVETRLARQLSVPISPIDMGSSYFTLIRYERGDEFPSGKMLLKLVDVLGFELALRHKKFSASARSSKTVAAPSEWESDSPTETTGDETSDDDFVNGRARVKLVYDDSRGARSRQNRFRPPY
jgi:hypothetical protein